MEPFVTRTLKVYFKILNSPHSKLPEKASVSSKPQLLESLLKNDPKGISLIYQSIFPKVRKFVENNQGDENDAKDIFQKVLLQLITRIKVSDYQLIDSFEAYLFTACKNLWRRELNRKNKVTNRGFGEHRVNEETHDMAVSILEQERWELYNRCFAQLSENCRQILGMYFEKVSYHEMKERLSYSSETVVRQRVFKCKSKLSEMIRNSSSYKRLRTL